MKHTPPETSNGVGTFYGRRDVEEVFNTTNRILTNLTRATHFFLEIGRDLAWMREGRRYRLYGEHIRRWSDYLLEIGLKKSTANNLIQIYQKYRTVKLPPGVSYRRLVIALPFIKTPKDAEEWVRLAATPGFGDAIREARGRCPTDQCEHPQDQAEFFVRCGRCGKWLGKKEL